MSMSFSEGVALGMISGDAYRAQRKAYHAASENDDLQAENDKLRAENARLRQTLQQYKQANDQWLNKFNELMDERNELVPSTSVGLILSDGFVKALQLLPIAYADQVKKQVVEHAQGRFKVLDADNLKKRSLGQKMPPTIEEMLKAKHDYRALGFK